MTKKRKIPTNIPQLLPNKKKELLKLCSNPEAIKRIIEMNKSAAAVLEKKETARSVTIGEWVERAFKILPEDFQTEANKEKLNSLFQDPLEADMGCVTDDSCNERKAGDDK